MPNYRFLNKSHNYKLKDSSGLLLLYDFKAPFQNISGIRRTLTKGSQSQSSFLAYYFSPNSSLSVVPQFLAECSACSKNVNA